MVNMAMGRGLKAGDCRVGDRLLMLFLWQYWVVLIPMALVGNTRRKLAGNATINLHCSGE